MNKKKKNLSRYIKPKFVCVCQISTQTLIRNIGKHLPEEYCIITQCYSVNLPLALTLSCSTANENDQICEWNQEM